MIRQDFPAPDIQLVTVWHGGGGLTRHNGCSTLAGRNIDLYAIGGSTRVVEAGRSRPITPAPIVPSADRQALKDAVIAAGGFLDDGHGWMVTIDRAGHLRQRRVVSGRPHRDRSVYLAKRQAAHETQWALTGPHFCACGCQTEIGPGNYDRPRSFAPGHTSRTEKARRQKVYAAIARQEKADLRTSRRVRMLGPVESVVAA
jgi:hypothetical protein